MQIIFESRDVDGNQLRDFPVERVRFALRRLTALVPRVKVQHATQSKARARP